MTNNTKHKSAVIAFSGGLDTSMLVPYMRETYGLSHIVTCFVDTGGGNEDSRAAIASRAQEIGADEHICIDACADFYEEIIKYLIFGNVSRDGYPLCVGAERVIQARAIIELARERAIGLVANGSTGAGNDQYRFDLAAYVMGQDIECVTPVREHSLTRSFSQNFLKERGISVPEKSKYSYNAGLWGVSIGGEETHTSRGLIPEDAWYSPLDPAVDRATLELTFDKGEAVSVKHGAEIIEGPLAVIQYLAALGGRMGIGRHYHVGTSIPGKKGRIAYESPAADILYEAHRTLEKHTMTQAQISFKKQIGEELGRLIHEACAFDPLMADLKACLHSSQKRVSGTCTVYLKPLHIEAVTVSSPYDLLSAAGSLYGEHSDFYGARDAQGAAKLHAYEQLIYRQTGKSEEGQ
jgi:argininosuccinate synthase